MSKLQVKPNHDLQTLNTLSVPSIAEFFTEIQSDSDYLSLLSFLNEKQCQLLVLGGGSNVLLPASIPGLVAKIESTERNVISETESDIVIQFSAGESWHDIVMWSVEHGFYGLENLALIPGSIGAAPIQNIGAYGVELEHCCEYVKGIFLESGKKLTLNHEQCQFAYRDSVFKRALKDKILITHVALRLKKEPSDSISKAQLLTIEYPALKSHLLETYSDMNALTAKNIADTVIEIRQSKLPDPSDIPNAGSFFKNPVVSKNLLGKIKQHYPDVVAYPVGDDAFKLAAGWLIDKAGWKGKVVDGVAMHDKQALVLTNPQRVSSKKLLAFSNLVRHSVRDLFGVDLEIEPRVF